MRLIIGILIYLAAHTITWFQLNGQFIWTWFEKNKFILALFGIPISYLYIYGTKYIVQHFNGVMWPNRFIGFGIGILVYALFVGIFFKEGITLKTLVSLLLSSFLIFMQIFWK
tara:strand:+ start:21379 stop:21717 length:339 start_codon:yes stop_codon:yes gene_type:complete